MAVEKGDNRGVIEAAGCFMARWHGDDAENSRLRHTAEDAKSDDERKGGEEAGLTPLSTNAEKKRCIVWQGTGSTNKWDVSCYSPRILVVAW